MSTATLARPLLWTLDQPNRCACDDTYRPQLNAKGKLVKSRDRAWRMPEQTSGSHCLQEQARVMAARYGLHYQHHNDSRKANAGYPDVHIWASDGRGSVYIELKTMGESPTPVQAARMASLAAAGHPVYLGRPCCLLTGTLDQIMADRAGVEPRGEYVIAAAGAASVLPTAPELAATRPAPAPRRPRPKRELPGTEPPTAIPRPRGYVVSVTAAATDPAATTELEGWLRAAGFAPADVPFPIRIVTGGDQVAVQVGTPDRTRVWRGGRTRTPFPEGLAERLHADVRTAHNAGLLMVLIHDAIPKAERPDRP